MHQKPLQIIQGFFDVLQWLQLFLFKLVGYQVKWLLYFRLRFFPPVLLKKLVPQCLPYGDSIERIERQ